MSKSNTADRQELPVVNQSAGICGGSAVIRATRIPVWAVCQLWHLGASNDEILAAYPSLTAGDLVAVRQYAIEHVEEIAQDMVEQQGV